jgi:hypothetical protein
MNEEFEIIISSVRLNNLFPFNFNLMLNFIRPCLY